MNDTRLQLLISRVTGGDASDEEWREFVAQAEGQPQLWRELAQTQRDHTALTRIVSDAGAVADHALMTIAREPRASVLPRLGAWSGWAAAAAIAVVALGQLNAPVHPTGEPGQPAALAGVSFGDALRQYLDTGRESGHVIAELPNKLLVESRPVQTGAGIEVIYVRQVLERTVVPEMYQVAGQDEFGRPTLVRFNAPPQGSL